MTPAHSIQMLLAQAMGLHRAGRLQEADALYRTILASCPSHAEVLNLRSNIQFLRGDLEGALRLLGLSVAANPNQPNAHNNQGVILQSMRRYEDALHSYNQALALQANAAVYNNRGVILHEMKRYGEALASYDKALAINARYAEAHNNRGAALKELGRYDEALASCNNALALKPGYAEAHNNRGAVFQRMKCYDEALQNYAEAISLKPDYAEAYSNRGVALQELRRYGEALQHYDKAIALNPGYAEAYNGRGSALHELKRFDEALVWYDKAIAIRPEYAEAHVFRGNLLKETKRHGEALASYNAAFALDPGTPYLLGSVLHGKMLLCDWQGLDVLFDGLASALDAGKSASSPFAMAAMPLPAAQQRRCAEIYVKDKYMPHGGVTWNGGQYAHDKIRLGYFSADFHGHATAYLIAGLIECHDRSTFEVTGFSFGPRSDDAMRKRLERAFNQFVDVSGQSDSDIAALARRLEIDIAIDLKGFTQDSRPGIFALRAAPLQVNYLGYPGTIGAPYMDYLIADPILIPTQHRQHYSERIAYLPNSYQVNDAAREISGKRYTRREEALPEHGFVFCCFNNAYKISPDVFSVWMRLLKAVPGGVLWLLEGHEATARNLRAEAECRGVSGNRLVFACHRELPCHLARHRLADLFLDTFYYNAHTTASDALWAGVPVLTCLGGTFAGRVAASLVNAVGLPEMVTHSSGECEALALALAADPPRLSGLRQTLARNRATCPLFDTALFTRHIEIAYRAMYKKHQAGARPGYIHVGA